MKIKKDLTGQKFGRLTAIEPHHKEKDGRVYWKCLCDCGKNVFVGGAYLSYGSVKSCGCLRRDICKSNFITHGMSKTRLYNIWQNMRIRCEDKNDKFYYRYGGRGIKVCPEWHSFEVFLEWVLLSGYEKNLTIDRINNNGDYSPENCKWATQKQQANNRSNNRILSYNEESRTLSAWAEHLGIKRSTLSGRVRSGWDIDECLYGRT